MPTAARAAQGIVSPRSTSLSFMSFDAEALLGQKNVLGKPLASCCFDPVTGYFRDGFCHTLTIDAGEHTACVQLTGEFLSFSQAMGNDLITPIPQFNFPGLKPGDYWCVCAGRWFQAYQAGVVAKLRLEGCHESLLKYLPLKTLMQLAVD